MTYGRETEEGGDMPQFEIISDSGVGCEKEIEGISIVPFDVTIQKGSQFATYQEGGVDPRVIIRQLHLPGTTLTSAHPAVGTVLDVMHDKIKSGSRAFLLFCVPKDYSGTFGTFTQAVGEIKEEMPEVEAEVYDCGTLSGCQEFLIETALEARGNGASLKETIELLDEIRPRLVIYATFGTLKHVRKSGRAPQLKEESIIAHVKSIVKQRGLGAGLAVLRRIPFVKPTIIIKEGKVGLVREIPSIHFESSVETMIERISKDVLPLGIERVYVVDSYLPSEPVDCVRKATGLLRTFYGGPIELRKVPAVVMAITGDVVLAVGCVTKRANPES